MSKELTFKSGSEELRKFCESAATEAVMERFGKYLDLDDPETQNNAELIAEELQRTRETRARIEELTENSLWSWLEEVLNGADFKDMECPLTPEQKKVLAAELVKEYVKELSQSQREGLKKDFIEEFWPRTDQPGAF